MAACASAIAFEPIQKALDIARKPYTNVEAVNAKLGEFE